MCRSKVSLVEARKIAQKDEKLRDAVQVLIPFCAISLCTRRAVTSAHCAATDLGFLPPSRSGIAVRDSPRVLCHQVKRDVQEYISERERSRQEQVGCVCPFVVRPVLTWPVASSCATQDVVRAMHALGDVQR